LYQPTAASQKSLSRAFRNGFDAALLALDSSGQGQAVQWHTWIGAPPINGDATCLPFDFNGDGDVDLMDFALFENAFTGE